MLGAAAAFGAVPRVWRGVCSGLTTGTPPKPEHYGTGGSGTPPTWGGPDVLCLFPHDSGNNPVPNGWGSRGEDKPDQPTGSFCAPPRS